MTRKIDPRPPAGCKPASPAAAWAATAAAAAAALVAQIDAAIVHRHPLHAAHTYTTRVDCGVSVSLVVGLAARYLEAREQVGHVDRSPELSGASEAG